MKLIRVIQSKIVKKDNKYQVQSEKGKNLGTYDTKEQAEKRLKQVEMFKHMKKKSSNNFDDFIQKLINNEVEWDLDFLDFEDVFLVLYDCEYKKLVLELDFNLEGFVPEKSEGNKWTAPSSYDYYGHDAYFEDFFLNKITLKKIDNESVNIEIPTKSKFGEKLYDLTSDLYKTMEEYFPY